MITKKHNKLLTNGFFSRRVWWILALCLVNISAYAETIKLKGHVVSGTDKLPLIGATVLVEGTNKGATTDIDGNFILQDVPDDAKLVISYLGFIDKRLKLDANKTDYMIVLQEDTKQIDEVVVVGYGTMRKKELTGAVSRVDSEQLASISTSDLGTALQGSVAGVSVQASSGEPGAAANIQIRGISSINGGNQPLYVVDGIPQSGNPGLSNNEIASIDILKDAASAAIYGTRGAGGVILITTKQGEKGKMKVSLDGYYGVQKITSGLHLMNTNEFVYQRMLVNRYTNNRDDGDFWTQLELMPNNFTNDNNLLDVVQNDYAPVQDYSLTLSGGVNNLTYNLVGSYFSQDGTIINTSFERYSARGNTRFKKDKFSFDTSLSFKLEDKFSPAWGLLTEAYKFSPYQAQIDPDATDFDAGTNNDQAISYGSVTAKVKELNQSIGQTFTGNIQAAYDILKSLRISTRFGVNYGATTQKQTKPLFKIYDLEGQPIQNNSMRSSVRRNQINTSSLVWESDINYNKTFGKHSLKLTGVFSMERYSYESFFAQSMDLFSNDITNMGGGTADMTVGVGKGTWGQDRVNSLVGMMARGLYQYDDRYMLSASVRRDGSSRFTSKNRWGTFPSVSAGWNVSEEAFWGDKIKDVFSRMKIRASYGTTGNQNFADYSFASTITTHRDYAFGTEDDGYLSLGATQMGFSNDAVQWETTCQTNLGIDLGFFNEKLSLSADIYQTNKKNMLFPLLLPSSAGAGSNSSITLNIGDMENKGVELAVGYRDRVKSFSYDLNFTYSKNQNLVTRASTEDISYFGEGNVVSGVPNTDLVTGIKEGYEAGAFFVMETDGIADTETKLAEYQKFVPNAQMGDLMYIDQNGDGRLNDADRIYGGSGAPEHELGFSAWCGWNGFDFQMRWFASLGNEIINGTKVYTYMFETNKDLVYQWTPVNPYSTIPINRGRDHYNYRSYADIWVEDGSFLRLKNITLGYSLPKSALKKMRLSKMRFYVSADNLFTFTNYDGYDPEIGGNGLSNRGLDRGSYPISANYRGGLQITF